VSHCLRLFVSLSIRPSVRPSVCPSVSQMEFDTYRSHMRVQVAVLYGFIRIFFVGGRLRLSCGRWRKVYVLTAVSTVPSRSSLRYICGFLCGCRTSADVISAVSETAHLVAHQRTQHSIVVRPTAVRTISTDIICQTIVQHCRTSDLELTVTCCVKLRLSA